MSAPIGQLVQAAVAIQKSGDADLIKLLAGAVSNPSGKEAQDMLARLTSAGVHNVTADDLKTLGEIYSGMTPPGTSTNTLADAASGFDQSKFATLVDLYATPLPLKIVNAAAMAAGQGLKAAGDHYANKHEFFANALAAMNDDELNGIKGPSLRRQAGKIAMARQMYKGKDKQQLFNKAANAVAGIAGTLTGDMTNARMLAAAGAQPGMPAAGYDMVRKALASGKGLNL